MAQHAAAGRRRAGHRHVQLRRRHHRADIRRSRRCGRRKSACGSRCESADVGIWDMDYATGVLRWSEILEAQYGLPPGTFGGTFEAFIERDSSRRSRRRCSRRSAKADEVRRRFLAAAPIDLARRHGALAERRRPHPPRRARRAGARRRHLAGRHRAPHAGGAVSAGAEDGSGRPAGRRRGARLQQSADGDPRLLRAAAGRSRSGRSAPGRHRGDPEGGHAAPRGSPASCWPSAASRSSSRRCST